MSVSIIHKAKFWSLVPVMLLGGLVTTVLGFVHVALSDPSFAVQDRYYSRALSWDEHLAAERRSAELGWHAELFATRAADGATTLALTLTDRDGRPVKGARIEMDGFAVARSRSVVRATFTERQTGGYEAHFVSPRGGRWEFSLDAAREDARFTTTVRADIEEGPAP
jgi:nitrogen fixation protein FixH